MGGHYTYRGHYFMMHVSQIIMLHTLNVYSVAVDYMSVKLEGKN